MPTTLKRMLVLLATAALLLAGCAGSDQAAVNDDPQGALDAALDNLANWEGITVEFSLQSNTDSLVALSEDELTDEQAQQILDSSLVLTSKEAEDPADQQGEIVANVAGEDRSFEAKIVGTTFYVRADVDRLAEIFGAKQSDLEAFRQQYESRPGFEFIATLFDGDWVSLTGAEQLTGSQPPMTQQKAVIEDLTRALKQNSRVTAGDKEGPGGHLVVTVSVRNVVQDFRSILEGLGAGGAQLPQDQEVPDEDLVLDVWVEDEQLTQVELDVTQFAVWAEAEDFPEGVDDFRLRVGLEEFTDEIEEPDAAATVDIGQLIQLFMGGAPSSGSGEGEAGAPQDVCAEIEASLEGQPDEVIDQIRQQYKSMCPNLGR